MGKPSWVGEGLVVWAVNEPGVGVRRSTEKGDHDGSALDQGVAMG